MSHDLDFTGLLEMLEGAANLSDGDIRIRG